MLLYVRTHEPLSYVSTLRPRECLVYVLCGFICTHLSLFLYIYICVYVYNKPKCRRAQNMPPFVVACICFTIVFCSLLKLIEILYTQQEHGCLSSTETQCHETRTHSLKGVSARVKERTMSLSCALTRQINAKQRSSCVVFHWLDVCVCLWYFSLSNVLKNFFTFLKISERLKIMETGDYFCLIYGGAIFSKKFRIKNSRPVIIGIIF